MKRKSVDKPFTIFVFPKGMAGGFKYKVSTLDQVMAHMGAIVASGYRRVDQRGNLVWLPPHMIYSVKASGPGLDTKYPDEPFRT